MVTEAFPGRCSVVEWVRVETVTSRLLVRRSITTISPNSIWLDSTRLDRFDFVEPVETSVSSETSRAVPTWRTTNKLVQV